jgi:hypothetical protein
VSARYGDSCAALLHHKKHNWYWLWAVH